MLPRLLPQHRRRFHALVVAGALGALCFGSAAGAAAQVRAGAAVVGGDLASSGWPSAAALLNSWMPAGHDFTRSFCGGTLVAPTAVVTAAHCVDRMQPEDVHVVVGVDDLSQASESDAVAAAAIALHPSSDIAVLTLERATGGRPAPLARAGDWARTATAAGWGDTSAGSGEGSGALLETGLRLRSDRACGSWWEDAYDPRTMLCAGGDGADMCEGDSGGPIMIGERLLGVTSFGDMECGASGAPGVFIWVAGPALRGWLLAQIGETTAVPVRGPSAKGGAPHRRRSHSRQHA